ncbi:hypothetical protein ANO11243_091180 [Dothideomycetidae sp. 11243]|nr:hypothetical protein ANO11243_091180 [fungal sp. No.11243]
MRRYPDTYPHRHGPTPFVNSGPPANWTVIPRLHKINVPTLIFNREHDAQHDIAQVPMFELIPRLRWVTIAGASHSCGFEDRERVLGLVADFVG